MFQVWCFEVIREECKRTAIRPANQTNGAHATQAISAPIHATMQQEVNQIGDHIKKLFAYRFQVLPFIYTHLVSAASTLYLIFAAFSKGLYFTPDAGVGFGLILPFCGVFMSLFTIYGLLEVGNTILDPFGNDPEDFALLHFVEYTLGASFEATLIKPCGARRADRAAFYTAEELMCAKLVCMKMVRRHRWLKMIGTAKAASAVREMIKSPSAVPNGSTNGMKIADTPEEASLQHARANRGAQKPKRRAAQAKTPGKQPTVGAPSSPVGAPSSPVGAPSSLHAKKVRVVEDIGASGGSAANETDLDA